MKANKKFFKFAGHILGLLLIGYLSFYLVFDLVEPNATAKRLGYKTYNVQTGSMDPVLGVGDLILTVKHDFNDLKKDDIITFVAPTASKDIVTHYFVRYETIGRYHKGELISEPVIITRPAKLKTGDVNLTIDADGNEHFTTDWWKIPKADYIGKVVYTIPNMGKVTSFFQSWMGLTTLALAVGFVYVSFAIVNKIKEDKKKELPSDKEA